MRILQVLPRYAPAWSYGGGVRMFWTLATELAARGHEIRVVTSDSLGPDQRLSVGDELLAHGIRVSRYPNRFNRLSARFGALFYRPVGMRQALDEAMHWADIVHMGESRGPHNVWSAEACRRNRVPLIWSPYGGLPKARGVRGMYRKAYDAAFTTSIVSKVDRFVAQTPHETDVLRMLGASANRIRLIPLCVKWSDFERVPQRGAFRDRLGLHTNDHLIVSVARLSPVKGLDILIRAFSKLPTTAHGPYLAVVGWDHGAQSGLRKLAADLAVADRVKFTGPLFGEERMLAYVDADVFALAPRMFEETSLAALEAAACGVPTVLTHECEIPGMSNAGGGLVVDRNQQNLVAALSLLLESPDLRVQTGKAARAAVQSGFTAERIAIMHEQLFAEFPAVPIRHNHLPGTGAMPPRLSVTDGSG